MASENWLVAGLGNPGSRYQHTRHNIGHMVCDELLNRMSATYTRTKVGAKVVAAALGAGGPKLMVGISEGYMNLSGKPVKALMDYFSVPPERLVVIHDELDLDFGRIKIKRGGSEGGHNGLKSITEHLGGHRDYLRIRVGVSRPTGPLSAADYVLQRFNDAETTELPAVIDNAADAVELIVTESVTAAQNTIHPR